MPKLRNATTDLGKFTQYLARKCVIHSPQAELDLDKDALAKSPRFGTKAPHFKGSEVHMLAHTDRISEPHEFVAISPKGRAMKVTVEEINPENVETERFQKVGS